jgi:DNA polymerase-3 subunit alpha
MVTSTKHATTKTGKPYGSLTIEDYTDTFSMTLFNKDYENFRKYMYDGYSLLIRGTITENSWKNAPELELRIKNIYLLSSVKDELVKSIQIRLPVEAIDEVFTDEFARCLQKNHGTTNLKIQVYDPADNIGIDMFCRTQRIGLSDEFMEFLTHKNEIEFKLL